MTTQPEPRSVLEALRTAAQAVIDAVEPIPLGSGMRKMPRVGTGAESIEALRAALAATPDRAPAVVPDVENRYPLTFEAWIESLHEDVHGMVWTTKGELRQVLRAEGRGALDVAATRYLNAERALDVNRHAGDSMAYSIERGEARQQLERLLAQREPAESQGPDGGSVTERPFQGIAIPPLWDDDPADDQP